MASRRWLGWMLLIAAAGAAAGLLFVSRAQAQAPRCPPGFTFDRMSGVGCVQVGCNDIANARYSYTGTCICNDGFKGCYELVDYSDFTKEQCGPFCPFSALTACVASGASCPGQAPAGQPQAPPAGSGSQDNSADSAESPQYAGQGEDPELEELMRLLEESLIQQPARQPDEWREAAAALLTTLGVLIFILSMQSQLDAITAQPAGANLPAPAAVPPAPPPQPPVEHIYDHSPGRILSGEEAKRYLEKTGALDRLSRLRHGADWEDTIDAMRGDPGKPAVENFAVRWKDDGTPDLDDLVIVTPELPPASPPPPAPPPEPEQEPAEPPPDEPVEVEPPPEEQKTPVKEQKPPDLKDLLERAKEERDEAADRKIALLVEGIRLSQQLEQAKQEWDYTRIRAVTDGVIDIADAATDVIGVKKLATETFGGAYVKDLVKSALKGLAGEVFTDGVQLSDLDKVDWAEFLQKPTGFLSGADYEALQKDPNKAKDYLLDVVLPGGGLKQVIQNALEQSGYKKTSGVYGPGETVVKGVRDAYTASQRCAELRGQMSTIGDRLSKIKSDLEDAQTDFELAYSAVKRNEANIAELKQMFPARFAHL
jgi:hypothetical protein